jgi:hypothetical protein
MANRDVCGDSDVQPAPRSSRLLALPTELRMMVLEHVLGGVTIRQGHGNTWNSDPDVNTPTHLHNYGHGIKGIEKDRTLRKCRQVKPGYKGLPAYERQPCDIMSGISLLLVNRQLTQQGTEVMLGKNCFSFSTVIGLLEFVTRVPGRHRYFIKSIDIRNSGELDSWGGILQYAKLNNDLLLHLFPGLKSVNIVLDIRSEKIARPIRRHKALKHPETSNMELMDSLLGFLYCLRKANLTSAKVTISSLPIHDWAVLFENSGIWYLGSHDDRRVLKSWMERAERILMGSEP